MHPWQIAVVAAGAALVGAGCAGEVDPTPTQPPPGEPPGEGQVVGAVVIANGVGYDLTTGQLGPPDIAGAAITAGFVSPGGGADATDALPVPVGLPDEGVAVESCVYWDPVAAAQGSEERSAPADDPGLGALISVGDFITLSYGGAAIEVPLVTEDDLPPQLEGQPLPPLYLKTGEAFDPSLYAAEPLDVTVAGSDVLAGFTAQSLVTPPRPPERGQPGSHRRAGPGSRGGSAYHLGCLPERLGGHRSSRHLRAGPQLPGGG